MPIRRTVPVPSFLLACALSSGLEATPLRVGVVEGARFGYWFGGDETYKESASFEFARHPTDLRLSYIAYDIDTANEVAIEVNGRAVGQLVTTPDDGTRRGTFVIGTELMVNGENTLVLRQRVPGYTWGVMELRLDGNSVEAEARTLTIDVTDDSTYGHRFGGGNEYREGVSFEFSGGSGDDLVLYYSAYDTDVADEVAVELNGTVIGHLAMSGDEAVRDDFIILPASSLVDGTNALVLRQRVPGYIWGVSSLLLVEYWCP